MVPTSTSVARSRVALAVALCIAAAGLSACGPSTYSLRERGIRAYQFDRYELARDSFERVVAVKPSDPEANYYLGLLALKDDKPSEARNHLEITYTLYEARTELPPEMPDLLDALAEAMYLEGERQQLIAFTDQAINRFGNLEDYLRKAEYLARLGDHDSALTAHRAAIEIADPGDPQAHHALADFYESLGDRDRALDVLKDAYAVAPENPTTAERLRSYGVVPGPTLIDPTAD